MLSRLTTAAVVLLLSGASPVFAACERAVLKSTVNNYFKALAAHDPRLLPLASKVKFTENGLPLKPGEGLWQTAGIADFMRSALDTDTCGSVTQAVLEDDQREILVGVRLQLDAKHRISEIEQLVAREGELGFKPQGVMDTRDQNWEILLPPAQRSSRTDMIAAANDYFDLFAAVPPVNVPFAAFCDRWENGTRTTRGNCSPKGLVLVHPERRVPVVDRETGAVAAFVMFNGALPEMYMFKMSNGQVELMQAVIGARGASSTGWPDDKSLRRRVVPPGEKPSLPLGTPPVTVPALK